MDVVAVVTRRDVVVISDPTTILLVLPLLLLNNNTVSQYSTSLFYNILRNVVNVGVGACGECVGVLVNLNPNFGFDLLFLVPNPLSRKPDLGISVQLQQRELRVCTPDANQCFSFASVVNVTSRCPPNELLRSGPDQSNGKAKTPLYVPYSITHYSSTGITVLYSIRTIQAWVPCVLARAVGFVQHADSLPTSTRKTLQHTVLCSVLRGTEPSFPVVSGVIAVVVPVPYGALYGWVQGQPRYCKNAYKFVPSTVCYLNGHNICIIVPLFGW